MPQTLLATPEMAAEYSRWFVNRLAYTRQSDRPHPDSGRHFYYRPGSKNGVEVALRLGDVRRHLAGEITLGLYAINPVVQRVKWMAIDADYKRSLDDLLKLQYELQQDGIQAALEQSRRGGHLWILFETPVLARHARVYIRHLAGNLSVPVKSAGPVDGIELFPKQDQIAPGQFGNAIRGPLGVHRAVNRRFWFYGAPHDLDAQVTYLRELRRVTESQLTELIADLDVADEVTRRIPSPEVCRDRTVFQILDFLDQNGLRRIGRNWVITQHRCRCAGYQPTHGELLPNGTETNSESNLAGLSWLGGYTALAQNAAACAANGGGICGTPSVVRIRVGLSTYAGGTDGAAPAGAGAAGRAPGCLGRAARREGVRGRGGRRRGTNRGLPTWAHAGSSPGAGRPSGPEPVAGRGAVLPGPVGSSGRSRER